MTQPITKIDGDIKKDSRADLPDPLNNAKEELNYLSEVAPVIFMAINGIKSGDDTVLTVSQLQRLSDLSTEKWGGLPDKLLSAVLTKRLMPPGTLHMKLQPITNQESRAKRNLSSTWYINTYYTERTMSAEEDPTGNLSKLQVFFNYPKPMIEHMVTRSELKFINLAEPQTSHMRCKYEFLPD